MHGVVAAAAFGAESWDPSRTQKLLALKTATSTPPSSSPDVACLHTLLPAVQSAAQVDRALADAVARVAQTGDRDLEDGAWMVLGTVLMTARTQEHADHDLAKSLDARIAKELARRTASNSKSARASDDLTALLEAAGNGGCRSCSKDIHRAIESKDARTRRIAVGALRFSEERGAADTACKILRRDDEVGVRAHAAWSLGWSRIDFDTRMECLRDASKHDPSSEVREAAAHAHEQIVGSDNSHNTNLTGG